MSERIVIYSTGMCCMSVCAAEDATGAEIEAHANRETPTGIGSPWRLSTDATFANGEPMPTPCDLGGEKRTHWLLNC